MRALRQEHQSWTDACAQRQPPRGAATGNGQARASRGAPSMLIHAADASRCPIVRPPPAAVSALTLGEFPHWLAFAALSRTQSPICQLFARVCQWAGLVRGAPPHRSRVAQRELWKQGRARPFQGSFPSYTPHHTNHCTPDDGSPPPPTPAAHAWVHDCLRAEGLVVPGHAFVYIIPRWAHLGPAR